MDREKNQLLGRSNPRIARLRALRRDASRRATEGVLLAEGVHLAQEALAAGVSVETVVVTPRLTGTTEGRELLEEIERRGLNCLQTSEAVLDSLQDVRSPQPILMVVHRPRWTVDAAFESSNPLVAVACGLQDPGNLGSLVRTAEAAGSTGCIVCGPSADPFHPRSVRASAGSLLRLPLLALPSQAALDELARRQVTILAADAGHGTPYDRCDLIGPTAILFGAEGRGLPPELSAAAQQTVRVPLSEGVESLSVSAAAAVVLFEAARQRAAAIR